MNETSPAASVALVFNWEKPRGHKMLIAVCIAGSALLHAFCFYLFQIAYPAAVSLLAPQATVHFIDAQSDEGRTILRWVDAEDPALASATLRPPDARSRALPRLEHVPSFLSEQPKLKPAPPWNVPTDMPSSQPPGPVPAPSPVAEQASEPIATQLMFSEELGPLGPVTCSSAKFTSSGDEAPGNIRFRVGVSGRGQVRFCFALNSSGDPTLDAQARQYVLLARFPRSTLAASDNPSIVWGVATVQWGNDIVRPGASPAVSP